MMIYLASPYWSDSELVRIRRVSQTRKAAAVLLQAGYPVYSPICHNYEVSKEMPLETRISHDFWMKIDLPILEKCDALWILSLDDWEESKGVAREISFAVKNKIPLFYLPSEIIDATLTDLQYHYTHESPTQRVRPDAVAGTSGLHRA